jgi:hypothetical protein
VPWRVYTHNINIYAYNTDLVVVHLLVVVVVVVVGIVQ